MEKYKRFGDENDGIFTNMQKIERDSRTEESESERHLLAIQSNQFDDLSPLEVLRSERLAWQIVTGAVEMLIQSRDYIMTLTPFSFSKYIYIYILMLLPLKQNE